MIKADDISSDEEADKGPKKSHAIKNKKKDKKKVQAEGGDEKTEEQSAVNTTAQADITAATDTTQISTASNNKKGQNTK